MEGPIDHEALAAAWKRTEEDQTRRLKDSVIDPEAGCYNRCALALLDLGDVDARCRILRMLNERFLVAEKPARLGVGEKIPSKEVVHFKYPTEDKTQCGIPHKDIPVISDSWGPVTCERCIRGL